MAKCDEGYLCDVCGEPVETILESDLYLRYALGEVSDAQLQTAPERHLRCNPTVAQFIVDDDFEPVEQTGDFDKRTLDPEFRAAEEERITTAWRSLKEFRPGAGCSR